MRELLHLRSVRADLAECLYTFNLAGDQEAVAKCTEVIAWIDGEITKAITARNLPDRSRHQAIHHLDGNPRNNDLSNLRIVDTRVNLAKLAPDAGEGEI